MASCRLQNVEFNVYFCLLAGHHHHHHLYYGLHLRLLCSHSFNTQNVLTIQNPFQKEQFNQACNTILIISIYIMTSYQ